MPFSNRREYMQTAYKTTTTFDDAAKEVFSRYGRRWKPRTMYINQKYYNCRQNLAHLEGGGECYPRATCKNFLQVQTESD